MTSPKLSERSRNLACEPGTAPADLHRILDATDSLRKLHWHER